MPDNEGRPKGMVGLRNGAISLALGIFSMSIIFAMSCGLIWWGPLVVAAAPVALTGLFFGAIGLNSTGKSRYLTVLALVVCFLALVISIFVRLVGWITDYPPY